MELDLDELNYRGPVLKRLKVVALPEKITASEPVGWGWALTAVIALPLIWLCSAAHAFLEPHERAFSLFLIVPSALVVGGVFWSKAAWSVDVIVDLHKRTVSFSQRFALVPYRQLTRSLRDVRFGVYPVCQSVEAKERDYSVLGCIFGLINPILGILMALASKKKAEHTRHMAGLMLFDPEISHPEVLVVTEAVAPV